MTKGNPNTLIRFRIAPEGADAFEIEATSRDVLTWEKTNRGKSFNALMRDQNMMDFYKIAHITARRLGLYSDDLATFERTCDLEPISDDEGESGGEADPTRPAQ